MGCLALWFQLEFQNLPPTHNKLSESKNLCKEQSELDLLRYLLVFKQKYFIIKMGILNV